MPVNPGNPSPPSPGGDTVYDALKRHEVHVLRQAELTLKEVAAKAGLSLRTVNRILKEPPITNLQPPASPKPLRAGRPAVAAPYADLVRAILDNEPELPTVEILRRARQKGYQGQKTAFYELVKSLRPTITTPMVRFEGVPGEFSQHDFGHVRVKYNDNTTEIIHFFANHLKWSRWMHVQIVADEKVESLTRALLNGFESFGGVPLVAVFDNPKTIVTSRKDNTIEWNDTFGQVALDYRFGPELCWPRRANQKGSVENLVGFVKNNFFKVRRFHDRDDLETQLASWLHEANHDRPCRATNATPLSRIDQERERLRPLVITPTEYALRFPVRVGPTGWVTFNKTRYSMPAKALNLPATLHLYPDKVHIVAGRFEAIHPRNPANGVSTLSGHAVDALASVSGKRAKLYYQRQRLLEVGPAGEAFLTELVHARPRTWYADVEDLFRLLVDHDADTMTRALSQALDRGLYGAEHVQRLIAQEVLPV